MKRQRGRGRKPGGGHNHFNPNQPNRAMESNGPDIKVRGPAAHIFERYLQLARDAASSGNRVLSENYLQHADHYFRLVRQMQPAMPPGEAWARMAHRRIERVEIDKLEGRVTSVLLTPYPPGIPLLIPGERFNSTIVRYLQFARMFNQQFPGFETDIHGLVTDRGNGQYRYFVDCVTDD